MKLMTTLAAATLAAGMIFSSAGCENHDSMRPDMDKVMQGDHGPQSADIREMASRLAPQLLQCDDIVHNQFKAVIVVKHMENKTHEQGVDQDIFLAKLAGNLASANTSDRIAFVEEKRKGDAMVGEELGGTGDFIEDAARTGQSTGIQTRTPQYFLYGTVYNMNGGKTTYYLFQFKLMRADRMIVWERQYEVRTLN